MQKPALVGILGLALLASAAASPLAFRQPGEFEAQWIGSDGVTWALLVFKDGSAADFGVASQQPAEILNESIVRPIHVERTTNDELTPYWYTERGHQQLAGPFDISASFPVDHHASLFVVAERMTLSLHGAGGVLSAKQAEDSLFPFYRSDDRDDELYRVHGWDLGRSVVASAAPAPQQPRAAFSLHAEGASHVEWYAASITCQLASACPEGGGPQIVHFPAPQNYEINSERHTYEYLAGRGMALEGRGTLDFALFGAGRLTLGIDGSVRLPLAAADGSCQDCVLPSNQTFTATGNLTLADLEATDSGLQANMKGKLSSAYFDEVAVDPESVFGTRVAVVGAVAVGGGFVLFKVAKAFVSALFTRHKEEGPLTNERRRRLYEHIASHPGIHFREALRGADVPAGSGRHHVTKLVLAGLVVERRHHNSVCLFPRDERFNDGSWQELAALRDPDLRRLHDWLKTNPSRPQNEIVAAFGQLHGWTRSTTQQRVRQLVRDGLVQFQQRGRYKIYSSVARPVLVRASGQQDVGPSLA